MNDIGNKVRDKSQSKGTFLTVTSTAQLKSKEAVGVQNGIIFKENDFMQKQLVRVHILIKPQRNEASRSDDVICIFASNTRRVKIRIKHVG